MILSTSQSIAFQKLKSMGSSKQAVSLTAASIRALIYIAARDLGLSHRLPPPLSHVPELFDEELVADFGLDGEDPLALYAAAVSVDPELETYVSCLSALHKARLKYREVLSSQPFATMDQVGPRALLQYNQLKPQALAALLVWRKWFYDIDNRAAQDTGYLFEPVIAAALGGVSYSASRSPVKRAGDASKGRQVDCLLDDVAYEIKIRITIAASGQGRWKEELSFPAEARACGFTPVLVVLDPTSNVKLTELENAYRAAGGKAYIGDEAWEHLKSVAKPEMAVFIAKYIEEPIEQMFGALSEGEVLPDLQVTDRAKSVEFRVGGDSWSVPRHADPDLTGESDAIPNDAADFTPGESSLIN